MEAFAPYVRTLGRGPGRSRALTREEAFDAFGLILRGEVDPHQVGAFLMLLRYRGEDPDEVSGLVEAARQAIGAGSPRWARPDLDWPSYGSGRTRGAPWYLLAALALAGAGHRIMMHGTNEFTGGMTVERALGALGLDAAADLADASRRLDASGFAYLPLDRLSPELARLIGLRGLLGLRSPVNTVGRLLDPADASRSVDGVFHPPYINLHLAVASRLDRARLVVVKGGGGEAERAPGKRLAVHVHDREGGPVELSFPPLLQAGHAVAAEDDEAPDPVSAGHEVWKAVWSGEIKAPVPVATVVGTIALALLALDRDLSPEDADARARTVWETRRRVL